MVTDIGKGKEFEHFSREQLQRVIEKISNDIDKNKTNQKYMKGAFAVKGLTTLKGENVDIWLEWNARVYKGMNDIGIVRLIYFEKDTFPDIVIDRYNWYNKNIKNLN